MEVLGKGCMTQLRSPSSKMKGAVAAGSMAELPAAVTGSELSPSLFPSLFLVISLSDVLFHVPCRWAGSAEIGSGVCGRFYLQRI